MGCFWSSDNQDYCRHCNRRAVNNLVIIDHECEICISTANSTPQFSKISGPKFGEYCCKSCGRFWTSRICWPNKYQMCKRCRVPVMPHNYRDLRTTDYTELSNKTQEHVRELCQMCQQLGYTCTNLPKNLKRPRRCNYILTK